MRWQTCMLPRELIWEGVAPPQQGMTQCARVAWQKNNCKAPFIMLGIQQRRYIKLPISIYLSIYKSNIRALTAIDIFACIHAYKTQLL